VVPIEGTPFLVVADRTGIGASNPGPGLFCWVVRLIQLGRRGHTLNRVRQPTFRIRLAPLSAVMVSVDQARDFPNAVPLGYHPRILLNTPTNTESLQTR